MPPSPLRTVIAFQFHFFLGGGLFRLEGGLFRARPPLRKFLRAPMPINSIQLLNINTTKSQVEREPVYYFSNRLVNKWNHLKDLAVLAPTLASFKNELELTNYKDEVSKGACKHLSLIEFSVY